MGIFLIIALYLGLFGLTLTSVGRQNSAYIVMLIATVLSLVGVLGLFRSRDA